MNRESQKAMFAKRLTSMSKNGKMSEPLRETINETQKALRNNDYRLASELTSVKSLIAGKMNLPPTDYPYREDEKFNEKKLGSSIYIELGGMHVDLAIKTNTMPSGMSVISKRGLEKRKIEPTNNQIVAKIHNEFNKQRLQQ